MDSSSATSSSLDPAAWVDSYGDSLYRYALSRLRNTEAAEEAVQDTFVAALKAVNQFSGQGAEGAWLMEEHPAFSLSITKLIGFRRRRIERRLKNLLFRSNRERLVHLLLDLVEQYGEQNGMGVDLGIRLSHQEFANVIGSTRESVTITLGQLRDEGLLQIFRQRVVLTQPYRLAESVGREQPRLRHSH